MDGHVKVSGAWKRLTGMHVNVGGVWKEINGGYIKVSGVWKQFYNNGELQLPASQSLSSDDLSNQPISARLLIDEDGGFRKYEEASGSGSTTDHGEWWSTHPDSNNPGDDYHVRITHQTGANRMVNTDMTEAAWESIATDRIAYFNYAGEVGPNFDVSTYLVEFSSDGGTSTDDSYTLTVTLTNASP